MRLSLVQILTDIKWSAFPVPSLPPHLTTTMTQQLKEGSKRNELEDNQKNSHKEKLLENKVNAKLQKLLDGKLIRKVIKDKVSANKDEVKMCISYHALGSCYKWCGRQGDNGMHNTPKMEHLETFVIAQVEAHHKVEGKEWQGGQENLDSLKKPPPWPPNNHRPKAPLTHCPQQAERHNSSGSSRQHKN